MGGIRLINTQAYFIRIGKQPGIQQSFFIYLKIRSELFFLFYVGRAIRRILEFLLQDRSSPHGGAPAVERAPPCESKPRFVPKEDEIRLDREAFLHHPFGIVNMSIKSAVGEH